MDNENSTGIVTHAKSGIGKVSGKPYTLAEVTLLPSGAHMTAFGGIVDQVKRGDLVEVTVDYNDPSKPQLIVNRKVDGHLTVKEK